MRKIVLGPPGTGKTTKLLAMVDAELSGGTPPEMIGYVSFTRQAAREATERACAQFGLERARFRHFRTIHSACFQALGLSSSDVLERARLLEFGDWAKVRVTGRWSLDEGSVDFGHEIGDRILFMENLARIRCIPLRQQYDEDHDELDWREVERVEAALAEFKRARHLLDYTDMLTRVADSDWTPNIVSLYVDESQDLSRLQWRVVDRFARGAQSVTIAGDDDQAIYRWAGADLETFLRMAGDVEVLRHSHRVTRHVAALASSLIGRVSNRRDKEWLPRRGAGALTRVQRVEDVDLGGKDVLILARNAFVLKRWVIPLLQSDGVIYDFRNSSSVRPSVLEAIVAWEDLRKGQRVTLERALRVYEFMSSGTAVARGHKKLPDFDATGEVDMAALRERGGLLVDGIWHEALDRISEEERLYLLRALRKGESLRRKPRVRVSTIHGSKGGEAEHVVLLRDVAQRTYVEERRLPEDEARVWYVAVTRSKKDLTIVAPRTSRHYDV